jgi:cation transport ATPase
MSLSSLSVISNALRLGRTEPEPVRLAIKDHA